MWILALFTLTIVGFLYWRMIKLTGEVDQLKRNHYYIESKLKEISKNASDSVDLLRVQLAKVASGIPVSDDLIRSGRLYRDITAEEAQALIQAEEQSPSPSFLIIDVRTAKEFSTQHIPDAKLVPFQELENLYQSEIPKHLKKVFVYCAEGDRSRLACDFLSRQGYDNLYNILGGLQQWQGPTQGEGSVQIIQIGSRS